QLHAGLRAEHPTPLLRDEQLRLLELRRHQQRQRPAVLPGRLEPQYRLLREHPVTPPDTEPRAAAEKPPPLASSASGAVPQPGLAGMLGAVDTAEDPAFRLDPVSDHAAAAVLALGSERVDRTLEAVKDVRRALFHHLEALV